MLAANTFHILKFIFCVHAGSILSFHHVSFGVTHVISLVGKNHYLLSHPLAPKAYCLCSTLSEIILVLRAWDWRGEVLPLASYHIYSPLSGTPNGLESGVLNSALAHFLGSCVLWKDKPVGLNN